MIRLRLRRGTFAGSEGCWYVVWGSRDTRNGRVMRSDHWIVRLRLGNRFWSYRLWKYDSARKEGEKAAGDEAVMLCRFGCSVYILDDWRSESSAEQKKVGDGDTHRRSGEACRQTVKRVTE